MDGIIAAYATIPFLTYLEVLWPNKYKQRRRKDVHGKVIKCLLVEKSQCNQYKLLFLEFMELINRQFNGQFKVIKTLLAYTKIVNINLDKYRNQSVTIKQTGIIHSLVSAVNLFL